jgi:hypothetical protein
MKTVLLIGMRARSGVDTTTLLLRGVNVGKLRWYVNENRIGLCCV